MSLFLDNRYVVLILLHLFGCFQRECLVFWLVAFVVSDFNIADIAAFADSIASFATIWGHHFVKEGGVFRFLRFGGRDRVVF